MTEVLQFPAGKTSENADAAALIRLENVEKTFAARSGDFHAVRDASLQIRAGEIFGIIGKSGAGKSTLLRLINLLERPDRGRVFVGPNELTALAKSELRDARRSIGMIFQQFNLLQNASVFDNVAFPLRIHGKARGAVAARDIEARVHEVLAFVGLTDKTHAYPAQLSGGQKQRVAIARALANRPNVLLCDEPTSALDPETTRSVLEVLRDINQRFGVTVVIVTHELSVVRALCQRVAIMENAEIVETFNVATDRGERRTALGRELQQLTSEAAYA